MGREVRVRLGDPLTDTIVESPTDFPHVELAAPIPGQQSEMDQVLTCFRAIGYRIRDVRMDSGIGSVILDFERPHDVETDWVPVLLNTFEAAGDGHLEDASGCVDITTSKQAWGYGAVMRFQAGNVPSRVRFATCVTGAPIQIAVLSEASQVVSAVTVGVAEEVQAVALLVPSGVPCMGVVFRTEALSGPSFVRVLSCHHGF